MVPLVGPSYQLPVRKASVQRSINLYPFGIEAPDKVQMILRSIEGLNLWNTGGYALKSRGAINVRGRFFMVVGNHLLEYFSDGHAVTIGDIATDSGPVSMDYGLNQLVIVDGSGAGFVLLLSSNTLVQITDPSFYGSARVRYLDGYFIFFKQDSREFYISQFEDALVYDTLEFASAEGGPDNLVSIEVSHSEIWLFCVLRTEVWANTGGADFPFSQNSGASIEVGCVAPQAVIKADNSIYWIGRDDNGWGIVYRAQGYTPMRISTHAVEEMLKTSTDLTKATGYAYQAGGCTFIAFNAPGLLSTWVFEASTGKWHERCDLGPDGQYIAHRATNHTFVFNKHLVGSDSGNVFELSSRTYVNYLDPLVRERISPHEAIPGRFRMFFQQFWLDCTTGGAGSSITSANVELSWSKDSGATWSNPLPRSIGLIGERFARVFWNMLGSARDRIWKVRFSGNAPFSIVDGGAAATQGRA